MSSKPVNVRGYGYGVERGPKDVLQARECEGVGVRVERGRRDILQARDCEGVGVWGREGMEGCSRSLSAAQLQA